jgi:hypothetical protein
MRDPNEPTRHGEAVHVSGPIGPLPALPSLLPCLLRPACMGWSHHPPTRATRRERPRYALNSHNRPRKEVLPTRRSGTPRSRPTERPIEQLALVLLPARHRPLLVEREGAPAVGPGRSASAIASTHSVAPGTVRLTEMGTGRGYVELQLGADRAADGGAGGSSSDDRALGRTRGRVGAGERSAAGRA